MNKTEMINEVAVKAGLKKAQAESAVTAVINVITETLKKGEKVQIPGFGSFEVTLRAARTGKNPATGEPMEIAASRGVKFKAGKTLKEQVK